MGNASTYFVKWSINVKRYLFPRGVVTYGPVMSRDVTWKGAVGSFTSPSGATNSLFPFRRWHWLHLLTKSSIDFLIPGHQYRTVIRECVLFMPGWATYTGSWLSLITSCSMACGTNSWCLPSDFRLYKMPCYCKFPESASYRKRLSPVHVKQRFPNCAPRSTKCSAKHLQVLRKEIGKKNKIYLTRSENCEYVWPRTVYG